jgi:membrane protein DedA with SNARE-associated domain
MSLALINHFLQSYGYLAVLAFVALESLGLPLPGETTLIAAGLSAGTTHHLNIAVVALIAAIAAAAGDNAGYWLGKHGGGTLVRRYGHRVGLDAKKLKVGRYLFDRHGGKVVFLGRFVSVLRTYAAFLAGLNAMPRSRFLAANTGGALLWSVVCSFGAYALGGLATRVGSAATITGLALTAALALVLALVSRRSMRRLEERAEAAYPESSRTETVREPVTVR